MQSAVVAKPTTVFPLRNVGRRAAARRSPASRWFGVNLSVENPADTSSPDLLVGSRFLLVVARVAAAPCLSEVPKREVGRVPRLY